MLDLVKELFMLLGAALQDTGQWITTGAVYVPGQSPALQSRLLQMYWSLSVKALSPLSSVLQPPEVGSRDASCPRSWMCIVPVCPLSEK